MPLFYYKNNILFFNNSIRLIYNEFIVSFLIILYFFIFYSLSLLLGYFEWDLYDDYAENNKDKYLSDYFSVEYDKKNLFKKDEICKSKSWNNENKKRSILYMSDYYSSLSENNSPPSRIKNKIILTIIQALNN